MRALRNANEPDSGNEKERRAVSSRWGWIILAAAGVLLLAVCSLFVSVKVVLPGPTPTIGLPVSQRLAPFTTLYPTTTTGRATPSSNPVTTPGGQPALQPTSTPTSEPTNIPTGTDSPTPAYRPAKRPTGAPATAPQLATAQPDSLAQRVDYLLTEMTLEEKVGQLFLVFFTGPGLSPALKEMINEYHVGGILLFNISDNIRSLSQVAQLINEAQNEAVSPRTEPGRSDGAGVPLFIAIDQEGGPIVRLTQGATVFPSNMAIGATRSTENARLMAQVTATELKALGINMNLAPVMDVNNNPDNPIIGVRSFGSSPEQVAELGTAMIETYKANGIIATAKHFPGHGDTAVDSHVGLPVIPHTTAHLESVELVPFQTAIDGGVDAIMTAHLLVPALEPTAGVPATLSPRILQDLLRGRMGFQGLIVTDSLGMGALDQTYGVTEAARLAFQAGADLLAFGADPGHTPAEQRPAYQRILTLVQSGVIPQSRLDESVRRILLTKARYGLLDWEPVPIDAIPQQVGTSEHVEIARKIALDSITLIRDGQGLLPIDPEQSVLVIWPRGAGNLGGVLRAYHANLRTLQVSQDPLPAEIELAARSANTASVIVVGTVNARRHPGQSRLVNALLDRPLVVVALDAPYDLMSFPNVATYLATYSDVPVSLDALAQVLFGLARPGGHLPVDLPGLYPLGHGITDSVRK